MKKKFKLLIALLLIAVVAFGVYFIFGQGTDNRQVRAKVYSLQEDLIVDDVNIFEKTNTTIIEMLALIDAKGYSAEVEKEYFSIYCDVLGYYDVVNEAILKNGLYVTNVNLGKSFNQMNSAYNKLVKTYKDGHSYLLQTYYLITNAQNQNVDYIKNFYNVFRDALNQLNDFYYNASRSYVKGVKNTIDNDNLFKLKLEKYSVLVNSYVNTLADETKTEQNANLRTLIAEAKLALDSHTIDKYVKNKQAVDQLVNAKLDFAVLIEKQLDGSKDEYIQTLKPEEIAVAENYINLVVRGE